MLNRRVSLVVSFIHCFCCLVRKKNMEVWVTQLCPTLWDPMDCSPPGSSVHEILQARILEWVAISFSRGSSPPRMKPMSHALQADSLPLNHLGSPFLSIVVYICQSQSLNSSYPPLPPTPPPLGIHKFVLYIWVSIFALQIHSCLPMTFLCHLQLSPCSRNWRWV